MANKLNEFFKQPVPDLFEDYLSVPFDGFDYDQIIKQIAFHKPFLQTDKIVIFKEESKGILNYRSIGKGTIYPCDTDGHYNSTIYLAMCGKLMASTASVHLAYNFKETAPQVIEADRVKPFKLEVGGGVLKPRAKGTTFWVETIIKRKKMQLVLASTNIVFGNTPYGTIEELKFILTTKDSIYQAVEVQEKNA